MVGINEAERKKDLKEMRTISETSGTMLNTPTFESSVLTRWMKLEPIIQSEVSQRDKDQYNILMHIYGI